jgi:hypothetical protein
MRIVYVHWYIGVQEATRQAWFWISGIVVYQYFWLDERISNTSLNINFTFKVSVRFKVYKDFSFRLLSYP